MKYQKNTFRELHAEKLVYFQIEKRTTNVDGAITSIIESGVVIGDLNTLSSELDSGLYGLSTYGP